MIRNYPALNGKWTELAGSPTFTADERGLTGVRRFKVSGSVLATFVVAMKGCPSLEQPPEAYPGFPTLLCVSATGKPMPNVKGHPSDFTNNGKNPRDPTRMSSEWFEVECRFEVPCTFSYSFAGEMLVLPTQGLSFPGETVPIDGMSVATTVPITELQIVRKGIPQWLPKKIQNSVGKINNSPFSPIEVDLAWRARVGLGQIPNPYTEQTLRDAVVAIGCAMFLGADAEPRLDPAGRTSWDAVYKFALRPDYAPWNCFFHPARATSGSSLSGRWEQLVYTTPTASYLFEPHTSIPFGSIFT